jgi:hypothetical protein
MSITSKITDGTGTKCSAKVNGDQALYVTTIPYPPIVPQLIQPFRQYLTDDGLASGSNDMSVDGSSTNVDFWVTAANNADRYITELNFIVGYGTSGQPNQWADGTALTNGSRLFYDSQSGQIDIHDGIQSNQDMFRLIFDRINTNWEVRHVNANNDFGYFVSVDLNRMMPPFGVKLDKGTTQRLTLTIRDNVATDADSFNCIAYGFDRFQ